MYTILTILIILVCVLLSIVVLIQNPKGGGLSSTFGGVGNQILGASRSTDIVEKATWSLAILLLLLSFSTAFLIDRRAVSTANSLPKSEVEQRMNETGGMNTLPLPQQPAGSPAQQQAPAQSPPAGQ